MSDQNWARITSRLINSFYVASILTTRKLLLASAAALEKLAAKRTTQAGRLLAVALEFPVPSFPHALGRDILQVPSDLLVSSLRCPKNRRRRRRGLCVASSVVGCWSFFLAFYIASTFGRTPRDLSREDKNCFFFCFFGVCFLFVPLCPDPRLQKNVYSTSDGCHATVH
jgi:hypothetical protein